MDIAVGGFRIQRGKKVEFLVFQIVFQIVVFDRRDLFIDQVDFFFDDIDGNDFIVLSQKDGDRHADIACAGNGDLPVQIGLFLLLFFFFLSDLIEGKTQDFLQVFQLGNRRHIGAVFDLGDHRPVDVGS